MRKPVLARTVVATILCGTAAAAWAASDNTAVGWPGNGAPLPTLSPGAVQSDDDNYLAPGPSCAAGTITQRYDTLSFTNAGNTTESVKYTVMDANGGCNFPTPGSPASVNSVLLAAYVGSDQGGGTGSFDPAAPTTRCVQVVSAGAGNCPSVTVPLAAFQVATFVVSTASTTSLRPELNAPTGTGNGLFGYQGDLSGTTPVSLQSFTVE